MRISTPDSVRTAVLLLVEVIDATIFLGTPFAAFTFASVALGTSSAPQARFFPFYSRETRSTTAYRVPRSNRRDRAEIARRPSLSLALALALSRSRSASDDPSEFSELRAEREATPFCALLLALARRDKPLAEAVFASLMLRW